MQSAALTTNVWTQLGTGLNTAIVEAVGGSVIVFVDNVPPVADSPGFTLPSGVPVSIPAVAALGGQVWVKATNSGQSVRYATA